MNFFKIIVVLWMTFTPIGANDSFSSEVGHVVGGAFMTGGIATVIDRYYPDYKEERGMLSFELSSAIIVVEQGVEFALNGNAKGQLLDITAHVIGSAFGAYVTDKFILAPIISDSKIEGTFVGLNLQHSF